MDFLLISSHRKHLERRLSDAARSWGAALPKSRPAERREKTRGAVLHALRSVKAVASDKPLPTKVTSVQAGYGLDDSDLVALNELFCAQLDEFLRDVARQLSKLAVEFSDPDTVIALTAGRDV